MYTDKISGGEDSKLIAQYSESYFGNLKTTGSILLLRMGLAFEMLAPKILCI